MSNNGAAIEETKPHHGTRRTEEPYARGRLDVLAPGPETVSTEGPWICPGEVAEGCRACRQRGSTAWRCWRRLVDVKKFRVQVVFEAVGQVEGSKEPMEVNPFRPSWGPGHVYSLVGPTQGGRRELVVCAVVAAGSPDEASRAVTLRASELAAGLVAGSMLRRNVRVQRVSRWRRAGRVRGVPGEGDDGLAGDHEPRHPAPPPGHLQAERRP